MQEYIKSYTTKLSSILASDAMQKVQKLGDELRDARREGRYVYVCGNGGSGSNAIHLANDLIYGAGLNGNGGLRVEALSANTAVITCLANDLGYENIYAEQLRVKGKPDDVLIVLSGAGNSANVVKALEVGNFLGMRTFAILGFSGGLCKEVAQHPIHFEIDDMQIAEDLQLIIGHMCMQWLCEQDTVVEK